MNNIHELLNTTPVLGVSIVRDTVLQFAEEQNRAIMTACLNVGVDPDALILTGQKNAELMKALKETRDELELLKIEHMERLQEKLREMTLRIVEEAEAALASNYAARKERIERGHTSDNFLHLIDGKIAALRGMSDFVEKLLDDMLAELEKEGKR